MKGREEERGSGEVRESGVFIIAYFFFVNYIGHDFDNSKICIAVSKAVW